MSNRLPYDANDFSMQARSALGALQHAMQVVINAGALLEQELGHPLNPPAPRKFLYPRDPAKTAATAEPATGDQDERAVANTLPDPDTPEACLLRSLHARPSSARFTTEEAAVYLNCTAPLLRSWRWQGRGPPFEGKGRLVRYLKQSLDRFMAA
jgi:hypothetical protein